jgi:hypothetical protein
MFLLRGSRVSLLCLPGTVSVCVPSSLSLGKQCKIVVGQSLVCVPIPLLPCVSDGLLCIEIVGLIFLGLAFGGSSISFRSFHFPQTVALLPVVRGQFVLRPLGVL